MKLLKFNRCILTAPLLFCFKHLLRHWQTGTLSGLNSVLLFRPEVEQLTGLKSLLPFPTQWPTRKTHCRPHPHHHPAPPPPPMPEQNWTKKNATIGTCTTNARKPSSKTPAQSYWVGKSKRPTCRCSWHGKACGNKNWKTMPAKVCCGNRLKTNKNCVRLSTTRPIKHRPVPPACLCPNEKEKGHDDHPNHDRR